MRLPVILLSCLTLCALHAASAQNELPDRRWLASPDNKYLVTFLGDNVAWASGFTIQDRQGNVVFASDDLVELEKVTAFYSSTAKWSPDSQILAIGAGHPKFLLTYLFILKDARFTVVPVPKLTGDYDNPWESPEKWLSDRRLVIDLSGPHAGHPGSYFKGKATIRASLNPPEIEVLYTKIDAGRDDP